MDTDRQFPLVVHQLWAYLQYPQSCFSEVPPGISWEITAFIYVFCSLSSRAHTQVDPVSRFSSGIFSLLFNRWSYMKYSHKRQFSRIKSPRPVILDFGKKKYTCSAINFSLGGVYVQGWVDQEPGDICEIQLSISDSDPEISVQAVCSVVRTDKNGLALQFTSMAPESYSFLQEALLYENNAHWCRQPNWCRQSRPIHPPAYSWKMA